MDDKILKSYLDAINHNILDDDLILLNQLATIKSLANRKAFSVSEAQISKIHKKFVNMHDERQSLQPDQLVDPNRDSSPVKEARRDSVSSGVHRLPRDLEHHELEESREYRNRNIDPSAEKAYRKPKRDDSRASRGSMGSLGNFSGIRPRGNSMIGRGSRYATPTKRDESPRHRPQGAAVVSNYYKPQNDSKLTNEPTNYTNTGSNNSNRQQPPQQAPKQLDRDMLQQFLDRMPTKGGAGGDKMGGKRRSPRRDPDLEGSIRSPGSGRESMSHGGFELN